MGPALAALPLTAVSVILAAVFNFHHLELFYYVARYGGIARAVKKIPYGIQQPALSIQMRQLEEAIGVQLFHRRVFRLTPAGEYLYEFIRPVLDNLKAVVDRLREGNGSQPVIRLAASPFVLHEALPPLLKEAQRRQPGLRIDLKEASPSQVMRLFEDRQIDVAITALGDKLPAGCTTRVLAELPPVLLVRTRSRHRSAEAIWKHTPVVIEKLMSPPPHDPVSRAFQNELARRSIIWKATDDGNSLGLVDTYVRHGFGVGLTLALPRRLPSGLRALRLPGFPRVPVGAIWQGVLHPVMERILDGLARRAKSVSTGT